VLEPVYTTLINLFSRFTPPTDVILFPEAGSLGDGEFPQPDTPGGEFPLIDRFTFGGLPFEVRESLGGHLAGQVFFVSREGGLLFTADSLINFESLTEDRKRYSTLAVDLITSVNVDSALAREERRILLALAAGMDQSLAPEGRRCLVCGGHGAVSVRDGDRLAVAGPIEHYRPR
jgi:glyoxylase-like metal-dependent hydrolase (beta-lactamase superfamily II)